MYPRLPFLATFDTIEHLESVVVKLEKAVTHMEHGRSTEEQMLVSKACRNTSKVEQKFEFA